MSEPDNSIPTTEYNSERQKLVLEEKRLEQEKELKLKELELQEKQIPMSQWLVPILITLIGGILGLIGNFWNTVQNRALERQKQEGTLILEAIKTGTGQTQQAAANLIFLSNAKLIQLTDEQLKALEDEVGKNPLPSLPSSESVVFQPSAALKRELQIHFDNFKEYFSQFGYQSDAELKALRGRSKV